MGGADNANGITASTLREHICNKMILIHQVEGDFSHQLTPVFLSEY
jgi:hypothetical protein